MLSVGQSGTTLAAVPRAAPNHDRSSLPRSHGVYSLSRVVARLVPRPLPNIAKHVEEPPPVGLLATNVMCLTFTVAVEPSNSAKVAI